MKKFKKTDSKSFVEYEEYLTAAYKKVSKSNNCNEFYGKKISKDNEPIANAILNFIASEKKFDTSLEASGVGSAKHGFYIAVDGKYFMVSKIDDAIVVLCHEEVLLVI